MKPSAMDLSLSELGECRIPSPMIKFSRNGGSEGGYAAIMVGDWDGEFTHVPLPMAVSRRKQIDSEERLWQTVLAATAQPATM